MNNKLNIYVPPNKNDSKCWKVFDPFRLAWPDATEIIHDYKYRGGVGMFWGLVGNNAEIMNEYTKQGQKFLFSDMPYFGRWNGLKEAVDPDAEFYWRICALGIHDSSFSHQQKSDRFEKFHIQPAKKRKMGREIILCPSSETITRFVHNCSVEEWVGNVKNILQDSTDRPIRVRYKPRANGTSGPAVAAIPFEQDIRDAFCVITSTSMSAVEAAIHGVPTFKTSPSGPMPCSTILHPNFPDFEQSASWDHDLVSICLNNLAYQQFTPKEMASGYALEQLSCFLDFHCEIT